MLFSFRQEVVIQECENNYKVSQKQVNMRKLVFCKRRG